MCVHSTGGNKPPLTSRQEPHPPIGIQHIPLPPRTQQTHSSARARALPPPLCCHGRHALPRRGVWAAEQKGGAVSLFFEMGTHSTPQTHLPDPTRFAPGAPHFPDRGKRQNGGMAVCAQGVSLLLGGCRGGERPARRVGCGWLRGALFLGLKSSFPPFPRDGAHARRRACQRARHPPHLFRGG